MTILLIEPDARTRELEALLLRYFGYEVQCAATAREGLHLARTDAPDLVVTDVFAPGEKATAFLQRLARAVRGVPVLVLTAYSVGDDDPPLRRVPCELLRKPCNADTLQAAVTRLAEAAAHPHRRPRTRRIVHLSISSRHHA
jgi:twitching motility two-component system response regulator PilH